MSGWAGGFPMRDQLPSHNRYSYSPIVERPRFPWPGGRRLAVYFAIGLEHYAFGEGLVEDLVPGVPAPDVLNTSWREYGERVGAWRVLEMFRVADVPLTVLLNSAVCTHAPQLVAAFAQAGSEFIAHGHSNSDSLNGMTEEEEAAYIATVAERIEAATGTRPAGWASPWIAETPRTPEMLVGAGYRYVCDWTMDDQPVALRTEGGALLSMPYSQELNDSSAMIGRHVGPREFAEMVIDQFDEMLATPGDEPLVMSVILHSFIIGQPFRLRAFRRAFEHILCHRDAIWLTNPAAIADHWERQMLTLGEQGETCQKARPDMSGETGNGVSAAQGCR
jgi:peptidoglycan/xylan/chitin deacetylase (PgdA/CDA1 family)